MYLYFRHYAGLALLKLADNFENHLKIAEEGGIQALLRLGRAQTSDEQIQYKAALAVGQLASNAVKLLPPASQESNIGLGAKLMGKIRSDVSAHRERTLKRDTLENSLPSHQPTYISTSISSNGTLFIANEEHEK